jgi:hypothetical protein
VQLVCKAQTAKSKSQIKNHIQVKKSRAKSKLKYELKFGIRKLKLKDKN